MVLDPDDPLPHPSQDEIDSNPKEFDLDLTDEPQLGETGQYEKQISKELSFRGSHHKLPFRPVGLVSRVRSKPDTAWKTNLFREGRGGEPNRE